MLHACVRHAGIASSVFQRLLIRPFHCSKLFHCTNLPAYVSIRQHTSAHAAGSTKLFHCTNMPAYVSIRQRMQQALLLHQPLPPQRPPPLPPLLLLLHHLLLLLLLLLAWGLPALRAKAAQALGAPSPPHLQRVRICTFVPVRRSVHHHGAPSPPPASNASEYVLLYQ
jgi:hypothetical protein